MCVTFILASCEKDEDFTDESNATLSYSTDSVFFDTVFTSVGSTSRRLKLYNPNEKAILISEIRLSGGNASAFSLNINGQASSESKLIKLNGKDSMNVFVKVNIDPTEEKLPFLVKDSIEVTYNGKRKAISLVAYGQNANFINGTVISGNTVWDSKVPYVVYKYVTIERDATLTINPGTKVLFHSNSTMNVKGTLKIKGNKRDSVLFASDRLEQLYSEEPAQWNGIHFYPQSRSSQINYATIKNAVVGITSDSLSVNDEPKLLLTNTVVKNMGVAGFLGYQTSLTGFNNIFYNCGQYLLYGVGGGNYNLKQNTFAGFNLNFSRKTAAVYFSDQISSSQMDHLSINFQNNIVWGTLENEFSIEKKSTETALIAEIKSNLLRANAAVYSNNGNVLNLDPRFVNPNAGNFRLGKDSPANKKGMNLSKDSYFDTYLNKDLKNTTRLFPSELGCYENK